MLVLDAVDAIEDDHAFIEFDLVVLHLGAFADATGHAEGLLDLSGTFTSTSLLLRALFDHRLDLVEGDLEVLTDGFNALLPDLDVTVFHPDDVEVLTPVVLVGHGEVVTGVTTAAFFTRQRRKGGDRRDVGHVDQVEGLMPARIVAPIGAWEAGIGTGPEGLEVLEGLLKFLLGADDANLGLHHVAHLVVDQSWILALTALKGFEHGRDGGLHLIFIDGRRGKVARAVGGVLAGSLAEHDEVRQGVAAEAVGAVQA